MQNHKVKEKGDEPKGQSTPSSICVASDLNFQHERRREHKRAGAALRERAPRFLWDQHLTCHLSVQLSTKYGLKNEKQDDRSEVGNMDI